MCDICAITTGKRLRLKRREVGSGFGSLTVVGVRWQSSDIGHSGRCGHVPPQFLLKPNVRREHFDMRDNCAEAGGCEQGSVGLGHTLLFLLYRRRGEGQAVGPLHLSGSPMGRTASDVLYAGELIFAETR
jgi:hypothetical protein